MFPGIRTAPPLPLREERGPGGRLETFVDGLGSSVSVLEVGNLVAISDVIVFAPPFEQIERAAALVGPATGKVLIDTTNPFNP